MVKRLCTPEGCHLLSSKKNRAVLEMYSNPILIWTSELDFHSALKVTGRWDNLLRNLMIRRDTCNTVLKGCLKCLFNTPIQWPSDVPAKYLIIFFPICAYRYSSIMCLLLHLWFILFVLRQEFLSVKPLGQIRYEGTRYKILSIIHKCSMHGT